MDYLVSFDLKADRLRIASYPHRHKQVTATLKTLNARPWNQLSTTWYLKHTWGSSQLERFLRSKVGVGDSILVVEVNLRNWSFGTRSAVA